jgi:hypothetical protein
VWNIFVLLSIAWFVLSIEFTLRWNDIRGVDTVTIVTTSQLIPFIIGVVSTLNAMHDAFLFLVKRVG